MIWVKVVTQRDTQWHFSIRHVLSVSVIYSRRVRSNCFSRERKTRIARNRYKRNCERIHTVRLYVFCKDVKCSTTSSRKRNWRRRWTDSSTCTWNCRSKRERLVIVVCFQSHFTLYPKHLFCPCFLRTQPKECWLASLSSAKTRSRYMTVNWEVFLFS